MKKAAWLSFWLVALIWGSSFLLIRVGVEEIPPTELAFIRTLIAAVGLNIVRWLRGKSLPRDWPTLRAFILIGGGNAAIPYTLIGLGEQNISSGMAAILQATASLFTLIIAHFVFSDERMTRNKVLGLIVGFSGIVVLSSESITDGQINSSILLGQLAIVCASLFYANFTVYSRTVIKRNIDPIVVSAGTFIFAAIWALGLTILEPIFGGRSFVMPNTLSEDVLWAALGLGFVNTFIAYLFYYFMVKELGSFRAIMVTYVVPVVGLILGALILDEVVTSTMIAGAALIFTGIAIVNIQFHRLLNFGRQLVRVQR